MFICQILKSENFAGLVEVFNSNACYVSIKADSYSILFVQAAITKQKIKEEEMQIKVVERAQQINLQVQEILRREKELEAQVRKPADAEKYKVEAIAAANKNKIVLEAEAEAESIRVSFSS